MSLTSQNEEYQGRGKLKAGDGAVITYLYTFYESYFPVSCSHDHEVAQIMNRK